MEVAVMCWEWMLSARPEFTVEVTICSIAFIVMHGCPFSYSKVNQIIYNDYVRKQTQMHAFTFREQTSYVSYKRTKI